MFQNFTKYGITLVNLCPDRKLLLVRLNGNSLHFSRKLERAEQLITGFGGEREKWAEMSQKLETQYLQVSIIATYFFTT